MPKSIRKLFTFKMSEALLRSCSRRVWAFKALTTVVSLSVCPVPDYKSRMVGLSKLKSGRKEAHDTGDPWLHLEVERSKVKVIRSCRQSDACSPRKLDNENSQKHQYWQEGCRSWLRPRQKLREFLSRQSQPPKHAAIPLLVQPFTRTELSGRALLFPAPSL